MIEAEVSRRMIGFVKGPLLWHYFNAFESGSQAPALLIPQKSSCKAPLPACLAGSQGCQARHNPQSSRPSEFHLCSPLEAASTSETRKAGKASVPSLRTLFTHETSSWGSKKM
ncbi:hypothetical protein Pla100_33570 [Neorhodopirellula pilleata]|uniref:Uncharacterized protein n=1 Tax=Neorhodopirellula pilleata TaxID=2714738 RepID=A0A5C6A8T5_9BACT|nr:hypothetical protein Pla100_33570 [Neorhodopirellula pilleata]